MSVLEKKHRFKIESERSVYALISEDGALPSRDILHIAAKLCSLLNSGGSAGKNMRRIPIHPRNIILETDGNIRLEDKNLPISILEKYLAPELSAEQGCTQHAAVYSVGMLMLFMATGQEKKSEADASLQDRYLLSLIERCTAFDPKERFRDTEELATAIGEKISFRKNTLNAVLTAACLLALIFLAFFSWRSGKIRGGLVGETAGFEPGYAGGYEQGFSDSPGIKIRGAKAEPKNGNLSGNLASSSGPSTAFNDKSVFFISGDTIFEMDAYTGEKRLLVSKAGIYCLQYYDGALYYCTEEKIFRIDPEKMKDESFCDSRGGLFYIFDEIFYLYDSKETGYLYRVNPERQTLTQLNGTMKYRSLNIVDGKLYYIDPDRGNCIFQSDLDGGNASIISSSSYESFCVYNGKLYVGTKSGLMRMELNGGNPEYLTATPAYSPNVSDGGIFYISGVGRSLEWMSADGRTRYTVVSSRTDSFSLAGQWIFYQNEDDGGSLWQVRTSGAGNVKVSQ